MLRVTLLVLAVCCLSNQGCKTDLFVADAIPSTEPVSSVDSETESDTVEPVVDSEMESDTVDSARDTDTAVEQETDSASDTDLADTESDSGEEPELCVGFTAIPGNTQRTIVVGGAPRSYYLHIPAAYTGASPVPLVVDFHPIGGNGEGSYLASPYSATTDPEGVITAYPDGLVGPIGTAWNMGPCCVDGADDLAFTRALVQDIEQDACIDASRVYAIGLSMGGGMVNRLACSAADMFAAVAPSAFDLVEEMLDDCEPERPITVVSFRGTDDPLVPYGGGYSDIIQQNPVTFLGAIGTFEKWAELNGCVGEPTDLGGGCQGFDPDQCLGGAEVVLCTKLGGVIESGDPAIAWPILTRHTLP